MEDIIMESVENLNGNDVSQKIMSCKGGHDGDENQQVSTKVLPKLFYPREMLIKLKNHPNSKEKPAVFDDVDRVSKNGMWDPEHWHSRTAKDPKRSNSGSAVGAGNKEDQQDKKRGKDEGDEFCFTPQRRSFVSGCHVAPSRRQEAEPALPAIVNESVRESTLPARRVGSGRLTGRDVEPAPVKEPRDRREPLRAPGPQRERTFERSDREPQRNERGGERNDRHDRTERNDRSERNGRTFPTRSDPRDKDPSEKDRRNYDRSGYDRDYSGRGDRGDRYNSRRKNEDDTPEWFFGGPSSQHDTIELRGFDEEKDRKQTGKAPVKKESAKERQSAGGSKKSEEGMVNGSSRPGSGLSGKVSKEEQSAITEAPRRKSPTNQNQMDFNIEDFLKMDGDLNGLGLGQTESEETSRGSKASRWFGKTTEVPEASKPVVSENVKQDLSTNQDAARSLLEMLQKGGQQQSVEHKKVVTAEELERSSGKFSNNERSGDDGMTVFNKLLAQVQETTSKPHSVMNSAPTEQDILANLLGKQMKIDAQPSQQNHPGQHHAQQNQQQDALSKFLQQQQNNQMHHQNKQHPNNQMMHQNLQQHTNNHQQQAHHPFSMHGDQQQHSDVHALMRDVANGLLTQHPQTLNQLHLMAMQQQQQQHHQQQQHQQLQHQQQLQQQQHQQLQQQQQQQLQQQQQQQRQAFVGSPQQSSAKQSASSSSPLSFTPTAVMRKMTAEKDKAKVASLDKNDGVEPGMSATSSPPANQGSSTSNRLTGRTASQVQGATRVSNQMRMNDVPVVQQQQQQQQQLLTGRPLVKGQEGILPFQQQPQQVGNRPFGLASASNAAITGVAVKMLEQQQQHQLLAAAVAASATQTQQQLKQQILQQQQQQQRTSPLQQSLLAYAGGLQTNMALQNRGIPNNVPVGNRTHFRPIHPQPMIPPISGYSPYMANQASLPAGQNRLPNSMGSSNQFYGVSSANNIRGSAQSLNALAALQQQAFGGNRSPNMLQGGNPLSRWFPPEILSQAGSGQMPTLPPMPNQKILSLEELERLHTSPMSH